MTFEELQEFYRLADKGLKTLESLVRLKRLKDKVGSTPEYEEVKEKVWADAFEVVEALALLDHKK